MADYRGPISEQPVGGDGKSAYLGTFRTSDYHDMRDMLDELTIERCTAKNGTAFRLRNISVWVDAFRSPEYGDCAPDNGLLAEYAVLDGGFGARRHAAQAQTGLAQAQTGFAQAQTGFAQAGFAQAQTTAQARPITAMQRQTGLQGLRQVRGCRRQVCGALRS